MTYKAPETQNKQQTTDHSLLLLILYNTNTKQTQNITHITSKSHSTDSSTK